MSQASVQFDFNGTAVLITGGSSGIGHAIAGAFANAGAQVTITGTRAGANDYDTDLSPFTYRQLDVRDREAVDATAASLSHLDILINNAGANFPGGRDESIPDVFEESVAINLFSAQRLATACKPLLADSGLAAGNCGASVINLASMSSFFGMPMVPGYGAAKAAIVQMTKTLAVGWAGENIRVNAIAPGLIETNMTSAMKGIKELEEPQMQRTPMRRWGTPEEIASAALFLASDGARYVTGQTLSVDGGYSAG